MARAFVRLGCLGLAAVLSVGAAFAQTGDFDAGFSAYAAGDYATALGAWRPLAEAGDAEAQHGLGLMYQAGRGVESDPVQAARWFRRAADQGFARAQTELGDMYARGDGVGEDMGQALAWWRKAADQGSARAQYSLGEAYLEGKGVAVDLEESEAWLSRAAGQGYARARAKLKEVIRMRSDAGVAVTAHQPPEEPAPASPPEPAVAEVPAAEAAQKTAEDAPSETAAVSASAYQVQLASFRAKDTAESEWRRLKKVHGNLLADLDPIIRRVDLGADKGVYYRLHAGPLADAEAAEALCRELSKRHVRCLVTPPA